MITLRRVERAAVNQNMFWRYFDGSTKITIARKRQTGRNVNEVLIKADLIARVGKRAVPLVKQLINSLLFFERVITLNTTELSVVL